MKLRGRARTGMILFICFFLLNSSALLAQPVLSTKQNLLGTDIYQDHLQKSIFYYSPPDVKVKIASSGSPSFILLQMRYTGTLLYADQNLKGFHNLLQLTVTLDPLTSDTYDGLRQALGRNVELRPLPIRTFYGELIIPIGDAAAANEKYRKVSLSGVEASGSATPGQTFWQERTFTMQLDNHEAQLLWDQVETGKLGVSFAYSFYADAIPGKIGDVQLSGTDHEDIEEMEEIPEELQFDDQINSYLIKANTFPIYLETKDFVNCLKRVDINEELPPAYASFEVRCYDFSDDLRPDLLKKIVEIKAFGVAKEYITIKTDFSRNARDISSRVARFPYAIRLDQPLEYRIIEINAEGEMSSTPWLRRDNWREVIDVTTPEKLNQISKRPLDLEIDLDSMHRGEITSVKCELFYRFNGKELVQALSWLESDQQSVKSILITHDAGSTIRYRVTCIDKNQGTRTSTTRSIEKSDDYLFVPIYE